VVELWLYENETHGGRPTFRLYLEQSRVSEVGVMVTSWSSGSLLLLAALALTSACGGSSDSEGSSGSSGSGAGGGSGGTAGGSGGSGGSAGSTTGGTGGGSGGGAAQCVGDVYDGLVYVNYDQFSPTLGSHCKGTNHQDIQGVEKLVFLGDSITVGTFPTSSAQFYRTVLSEQVKAQWPAVEVQSCAVNGARTADFFSGDQQISDCFPGVEQKKTLIVITMGGNDLANMAENKLGANEANAQTDVVVSEMRAAVEWLKDPANFPNGSWVVFANVYEYTDLTADLDSCPLAGAAGLSGEYMTGVAALTRMREGYMKIAVDTGSDMMFLGESFCGHGYHAGDANSQCYRGPGTANWFDITCIHPTPEGHKQIADDFWAIITE
jgi:lysophospholipase L1-like esterase